MPEIAGSDTPIGAVEGRPGVTVLTQENFNEYVDQELGTPASAETANEDPEAVAAAEAAEIEEKQKADAEKAAEPKEGDEKDGKVWFKGKWTGKHDFGYRVHLKTEESNKAAQAKIDAAAAEAKAAREEREAIALERDALKAKYEPPKSDEPGPEPERDQFQSDVEYIKAIKEWAVQADRRTAAIAQAQETARTRWTAAEKALADEIPDYASRLAAAPGADTQVSNELRDAIMDSDIGPKLRLHLAENPDVTRDLLAMPVGKMLKAVGKLEVALGTSEKQQTKEEKPVKLAEVSKAPAPITPIRAANPGSGLKIDEKGDWVGSADEYKAARLAGKIK